jgi:protoheme IX farnesyltransferase
VSEQARAHYDAAFGTKTEILVKTVSQIIFTDGVLMTPAVEATTALAGSDFGEALSAGIPVSDPSAAVLPTLSKARPALVADLKELFKIRVTSLVVVTAWAGFYLGSMRSGIPSIHWGLFQALLGIAFVTGGASAMNQVIERKSDAKMIRTAQRPLAAGRFSLLCGLSLGLGSIAAGAMILAYFTNPVTVVLTLFTAFTYVAVYTPLKRYTTLATFIGAFPGAMPPLLGWTAARGIIEWPALALFAILFVWQFPHFMAIAWLYREDYARAGIRMLPVVQPDGRSTVLEALFFAILIIPVSFIPFYLHLTGKIYFTAAVLLGLGYLVYTIRFSRITRARTTAESRGYARDLLRASVIYLPLLLIVMMLDATGGR